MNDKTACGPREWEVLSVDPFEIEISDVCQSSSPSCDVIVAMALSFHLHGQRKAVECRLTEDNRLLLVHGRVRTEAARLLRVGFEHAESGSNEKKKLLHRRFKLWVAVSEGPI